MQTIRREELVSMLANNRGAKILSLIWVGSDPARFKANRGRISKVSRYSGMVGARYDRKKAKSLGIDVSEVEVAHPAWKEHVGGAIYRHRTNGTLYVEFYPHSGGTEYTLDGHPATYEGVRELVKPPSKGYVPNYRTIKVDNLRGAVIDGTEYVVV